MAELVLCKTSGVFPQLSSITNAHARLEMFKYNLFRRDTDSFPNLGSGRYRVLI